MLILVSGFLNFVLIPPSPWLEIFAGAFGIGAGLTLDEFALWIHLEDVYWSKEGRASIDAVVVATLLGGLVVLGIAPFDASDSASPIGSLVAVVDRPGLLGDSDPQGQADARPDRPVHPARLDRRDGEAGVANLTLGA